MYLTQFLTIAGVHLLAVISPGPDFVMITRNALRYSRKTGVYSALGLGLGILVHVTYSLAGIGFVIAKSILLFSILKVMGAGYLIYIGYKSLKSKPSEAHSSEQRQEDDLTPFSAIKTGFLTNVMNPKVTLFFLSLFTLVVSPQTPLWIQIIYGLEMSFMTFAWFSLVAYFFSGRRLKTKIHKVQHYIEKATGVILILLGIKLVLSQSK